MHHFLTIVLPRLMPCYYALQLDCNNCRLALLHRRVVGLEAELAAVVAVRMDFAETTTVLSVVEVEVRMGWTREDLYTVETTV